MQSNDFTINGVIYTVEAWDSEGHGFYPMVHTQDGQPVNIGADAIGEDVYCATPEEAIEEGHQALRALATTPGYAVGHGVTEMTTNPAGVYVGRTSDGRYDVYVPFDALMAEQEDCPIEDQPTPDDWAADFNQRDEATLVPVKADDNRGNLNA